ncbi:hypothetical protein ACFPYJ_32435 [Paenibacillus solisilvae]|uniref:Uncharacterized protein n=1 Tax=Paenibacillus solisilvae TaxID=2486751 RepID=A0ABW0WAJ1_9BACL
MKQINKWQRLSAIRKKAAIREEKLQYINANINELKWLNSGKKEKSILLQGKEKD